MELAHHPRERGLDHSKAAANGNGENKLPISSTVKSSSKSLKLGNEVFLDLGRVGSWKDLNAQVLATGNQFKRVPVVDPENVVGCESKNEAWRAQQPEFARPDLLDRQFFTHR